MGKEKLVDEAKRRPLLIVSLFRENSKKNFMFYARCPKAKGGVSKMREMGMGIKQSEKRGEEQTANTFIR